MSDIASGRERARDRAVSSKKSDALFGKEERPTPLQRDQAKVNEFNREKVEELTEEACESRAS